jgi:hypothetical protein
MLDPINAGIRETFREGSVGKGFADSEVTDVLLQLLFQQPDATNRKVTVMSIEFDKPSIIPAYQKESPGMKDAGYGSDRFRSSGAQT